MAFGYGSIGSGAASGAAGGAGLGPWGAIAGGALGALSGLFGSNSQEEMNRDQLAQQKLLFEKQLAQQLALANADREDTMRARALDATQMDPLKQQKSRQLNALVSSLISGYKPSTMGDPSSGLQLKPEQFASFFTPQAREAAEGQFAANAGVATGGQYRTAGGVGYGGNTNPAPVATGTSDPALTPAPITPAPVADPRQATSDWFNAYKADPNHASFFSPAFRKADKTKPYVPAAPKAPQPLRRTLFGGA